MNKNLKENSKNKLIIKGLPESGKTTQIIMPLIEDIIEREEGLVILDTKEEYIHRYHELLSKNNYDIRVLNLKDLDRSNAWNPLYLPYKYYKMGDKDKTIELLNEIGKKIFNTKESIDPFWLDTSNDLFIGICLAMFEDSKFSHEINISSVANIVNLMTEKENEETFKNYFEEKGKQNMAYVFVANTINAPKETKGGILSTCRQKLNYFYNKEGLALLLSDNFSSITFNKLKNNKTALFIINKESPSLINVIPTMLLEQLYNYLSETNSNIKYNFILDNYDTLNIEKENIPLLSTKSDVINVIISTNNLNKNIDNIPTLTIKEDKLESNINNNIEITEVKKVKIRDIKSKYNYPKIMNILFLYNIKNINNVKSKGNYSINELLANIDRKIAELESHNIVFKFKYSSDLKYTKNYYILKDNNTYSIHYKLYNYKEEPNIYEDLLNTKINTLTEESFKEFKTKLINISNKWNSTYKDPLGDNCTWTIELKLLNKIYEGYNSKPENFQEMQELLSKYFTINIFDIKN